MTINLSVPDLTELRPRITVFGVGGAGGNAVGNMIKSNLEGVDFVVANTDAQALAQSTCTRRIQIGTSITEGLGAGSRPEVGRAAAEESLAEILDHLSGCHMVFITAGMGGGTGTGAGPVIARASKEQGILTVGVVTKPFQFEGAHRMRVAEAGIEELQQFVDTLLIIPNQNLFRLANEKTTFAAAFAMADEVLYSGVRGITDLMVMPGLINLDFADVRTVMNEMGKAMMGTGEAEGDKRALEAAEAAISNPLLDDVSMKGARGVLINITGGLDLGLYEVDEAANRIRSEVDPDANIIVGSTFDERMEGKMRVSVVATGIDTVEGMVKLPDTEAATGRPRPKRIPEPAAPGSRVLAMTHAIREGLEAMDEADDENDDDAQEEVVVAAAPVATPRPATRPLGRPAIPPRSTATQQPPARPVRDVIAARAAEPEPQPVVDTMEDELDEPIDEPRVDSEFAQQVKAKIRGGMGVFDRMMAGVKSARQANRAAQPARRAPAVSRVDRNGRVATKPVAKEERSQRETVKANDSLLPVSEDEEQLEIPAFLRRQAN